MEKKLKAHDNNVIMRFYDAIFYPFFGCLILEFTGLALDDEFA